MSAAVVKWWAGAGDASFGVRDPNTGVSGLASGYTIEFDANVVKLTTKSLITEEYEKDCLLGEGTYGKVYTLKPRSTTGLSVGFPQKLALKEQEIYVAKYDALSDESGFLPGKTPESLVIKGKLTDENYYELYAAERMKDAVMELNASASVLLDIVALSSAKLLVGSSNAVVRISQIDLTSEAGEIHIHLDLSANTNATQLVTNAKKYGGEVILYYLMDKHDEWNVVVPTSLSLMQTFIDVFKQLAIVCRMFHLLYTDVKAGNALGSAAGPILADFGGFIPINSDSISTFMNFFQVDLTNMPDFESAFKRHYKVSAAPVDFETTIPPLPGGTTRRDTDGELRQFVPTGNVMNGCFVMLEMYWLLSNQSISNSSGNTGYVIIADLMLQKWRELIGDGTKSKDGRTEVEAYVTSLAVRYGFAFPVTDPVANADDAAKVIIASMAFCVHAIIDYDPGLSAGEKVKLRKRVNAVLELLLQREGKRRTTEPASGDGLLRRVKRWFGGTN